MAKKKPLVRVDFKGYIIKRADKNYSKIKDICHRCKNLYNYCNFMLRQSFF